MNIARSSLKLFTAKFGSAGIQFVGIVFFARELGATQLGVFFLFQALLGMLAVPADVGLRRAVVKRISEGESRGAFLGGAVLLKSVAVFLVIVGILSVRQYIDGYVGADVASYLAVGIAIQGFARLSLAVLRGELRVGETAVLEFAQKVVWIGAATILLTYGLEAKALILGLLISMAVVLVWGWSKTSIPLERPSRTHVRSLFQYSKFNLVSSVGGYFYSWMDVAIIGLFLTQAHVGAYEAAWRVTAVTLLLSQAIATTIFPQVSQLNSEDAREKIESIIHDTLLPSMAFVIPALFGVLVFSREILGLLFGAEFTIASVVLVILMGEKVFQSVHIVLGHSLQAIDKPDLAALSGFVAMVLNLLLNVVLVSQFGIVGAAVATTISFVVNTVLHAYYLSRFLTIDFPVSEVFGLVGASAGMWVVLVLVKRVVPVETVPSLVGVVLVGAVLYGAFVLLIPSLRGMIRVNVNRVI